MHTFGLCLTILLVALFKPSAANEASRVLDSDLETWNRLKREAGYYTESGQWRGGLYRVARTTETGQYHCLEHTDTHCTSWNVSERSRKKHETGNCTCEETTSPYCQQWTCNTTYQYRCQNSENPATCIAVETLKCDCIVSALNERYCWKWRCQEDSNTVPGGQFGFEDHECVVGNDTAAFCSRWHGNTSSKYVVESSACECFERGRGFCKYWQCRERKITRCTQTNLGWCQLEIAIGVGGGLGLFLFIFCVLRRQVSFAHWEGTTRKLETGHVLVCFVLFCLPWSVGVAIWDGVFAMSCVFPAWSVALFAMLCAVKRAVRIRNGEIVQLPRIQLPRIQLPSVQLPVPITRTTKSTDDSQSDKSNDV